MASVGQLVWRELSVRQPEQAAYVQCQTDAVSPAAPCSDVPGWGPWLEEAVDLPEGCGFILQIFILQIFILQISFSEKPCWMAGDNRNLYLFKTRLTREWDLDWDCYGPSTYPFRIMEFLLTGLIHLLLPRVTIHMTLPDRTSSPNPFALRFEVSALQEAWLCWRFPKESANNCRGPQLVPYCHVEVV
ncbi:hypothetical protein B2K_13185 [Paenibacillus mucilaginosus K02]|uniref:Uncharacterized protein n=1 Tax=Paenibacillus mucilaginosus K02 TaxID=997761 RepID=I0BH14_9BACL|nr:hypothetical protein B2K_13185 [Paenibacillus mucilaginosus K02]